MNEPPMATDVPSRSAPMVLRILVGLIAGILALGATLLSVGIVLLAPIGMATVARIQRHRGHAYSRGLGWLGAYLATAFVACAIFAIFTARHPESFRKAMAQQSAMRRRPTSVERALRAAAPGGDSAVERRQRAIEGSRLFLPATLVLVILAVGAASGLVLGTIGWILSTLLMFAFSGRLGPRAAALTPATAATPIP